MFHLPDPFSISTFLCLFTLPIALGQSGVAVASGVRIKDLNIKERLLLLVIPETKCLDVGSRVVSRNPALIGEGLSSQGLEMWFDGHGWAYFG